MKSALISLLLLALLLGLALGLTDTTASPEEAANSPAGLYSPPAQEEQTLAFWVDY